MFNLNSIKKNYSLKLKQLKRNKNYKKSIITLNNYNNTLVKVLYKVKDNLLIDYINLKKYKTKRIKLMVTRYRFYNNKITKIYLNLFKYIADKEIDKTLYEYLVIIYTYGILLNVGVSYFDIPISFQNITIFGIWFYFVKEELFPMIIKVLRGVDA